MSEHANIQVLKDAYAAFTRGDIAAVMKAFATDIDWHIPGPKAAPYVGRHKGTSAVQRFFAQVGETVEFTMFEPREYVAQGDRVVVLGRYAGKIKSTGKPFDTEWAMAWALRDGKAVKFHEYTDTEAIGAAFR